MNRGNRAYNEIGLTTDIMTASSHRLIQLMLDKCLQHIESAKTFINNNMSVQRNDAITKSLEIIKYLRVCLNHTDGTAKEMSRLLDSLYGHLLRQLIQANAKNDIECLDHAKQILNNIKSGWDGIA